MREIDFVKAYEYGYRKIRKLVEIVFLQGYVWKKLVEIIY